MTVSMLLALLLLLTSALAAQHSTTRSNPFDSPLDRAEGERLFRAQCAACHGPNGAGGAAGPDLTTGMLRRAESDEALFNVVAKGIPGTTMPPYKASGREIWQVVAYVRTLSIGKSAELAKGDRARGAELFAKSGCRNCHSINNEGGFLGPDLGDIGAQRSIAHMQRSITDPQSEVAPAHWRLQARTQSGQTISGVRLNEDTFSYQYRDKTGLKSVLKSELTDHETIRTSAMPSFKDKLSTTELNDIIAFLANCRSGSCQ
jgi:putative heme-binding domain-containing protein